jgi:hypothetical protein
MLYLLNPATYTWWNEFSKQHCNTFCWSLSRALLPVLRASEFLKSASTPGAKSNGKANKYMIVFLFNVHWLGYIRFSQHFACCVCSHLQVTDCYYTVRCLLLRYKTVKLGKINVILVKRLNNLYRFSKIWKWPLWTICQYLNSLRA